MIRLPIENQSFKERLTIIMRYFGTLFICFSYDQTCLENGLALFTLWFNWRNRMWYPMILLHILWFSFAARLLSVLQMILLIKLYIFMHMLYHLTIGFVRVVMLSVLFFAFVILLSVKERFSFVLKIRRPTLNRLDTFGFGQNHGHFLFFELPS